VAQARRVEVHDLATGSTGEITLDKNLKVGLAQIDVRLGDPAHNLEKHLNFVRQARSQGVDLICFPELSITGYFLEDLVPTMAVRPSPDEPTFQALLAESRDIDILFGFPEMDDRRRFYISTAYLSQGEIIDVHRKTYLSAYRMFDEKRFFAPGDAIRAFDTRFGRIGILICEEAWHISPAYLLWLDGADILIHVAAGPGYGTRADSTELGSAAAVDLLSRMYAQFFTAFVLYCNRVGVVDGATFFGRASAVSPSGEFLAKGPDFDEALVVARLDLGELKRVRTHLPLLRDERVDLTFEELRRIREARYS